MENVIFSKAQNQYIPVTIKKIQYNKDSVFKSLAVEYFVYDKDIEIGNVKLLETPYGCYVNYIVNKMPKQYNNFGYLADRIEVWDCMARDLDSFEIRSNAAINSHAKHYLRGKRFEGRADAAKIRRFKEIYPDADIKSFGYNTIVNYIIKHTPIGERFNTMFLKEIPMYMPKALIRKYVAELLKNPIVFK